MFVSISAEGSVRLGLQYAQGGYLLIMEVAGKSCLILQLWGDWLQGSYLNLQHSKMWQ